MKDIKNLIYYWHRQWKLADDALLQGRRLEPGVKAGLKAQRSEACAQIERLRKKLADLPL